MANLAKKLKNDFPKIKFDFDIPFWLDDVIRIDNTEKPAYEFMIDFSDRIFLMSYRDSYNEIYSVSKDEIDYAINKNKNIILGLETKSNEIDKVTFFEEGKLYMNSVLKELKEKLSNNIGICIHHIKSWFDLKS